MRSRLRLNSPLLSRSGFHGSTIDQELNETSFPSEAEASTRIAAEIKLSLFQINGALKEIQSFNTNYSKQALENEYRGFALLEKNLIVLKEKVEALQVWHEEKHGKAKKGQDLKKLLLAEVSILLITPYIHRLLTTEDRRHPGGLFDFDDDELISEERRRLRDLCFQHIDPIYSTRYDGVCLASLMRSVANDQKYSPFSICRNDRKVSFWHRGHALVLAAKFFGAITCLEMVLTLGAQEDDDLILEKAVGHKSDLEVDGIVEKSLLYNRKSAERNLKFFTRLILIANAVVDSGYHKKYFLTRVFYYAFNGLRLTLPFNRSEAELRGELCYTGSREEIPPKLHFARFIWNLPETPLVKNFYRLGLRRIRIDHEFYIPPQDIRENAKLEGGTDPIFARIISNHKLRRLPQTTTLRKALRYDWSKEEDLYQCEAELSSPLLSNLLQTPSEDVDGNDVLLIHFHGGGFIALSSFSHENYTRIWARDVKGLTILSADYRLAPDFSFPYAFNDAYRTYKYAVETCERNFGFKPRKILLAGDSAGGNLACSVTVRAIQDNYRVPDGILLIYPVVDMRRKFSPSLMWSVNDRIVPFVFLECCMNAYLGAPEQAKITSLDTRCSPALAGDDILKRMPPTRIVVGDCDPLMDQSIRFAHHLARLKVDVQCKIFQAMPHGFCSFIWPMVGVPEVEKCVDACSELLRQLAKNNIENLL